MLIGEVSLVWLMIPLCSLHHLWYWLECQTKNNQNVKWSMSIVLCKILSVLQSLISFWFEYKHKYNDYWYKMQFMKSKKNLIDFIKLSYIVTSYLMDGKGF